MLPGQASMQLPSTPTMKTWQKVSKRRAVWGRAAEERDRGLRGGGQAFHPYSRCHFSGGPVLCQEHR